MDTRSAMGAPVADRWGLRRGRCGRTTMAAIDGKTVSECAAHTPHLFAQNLARRGTSPQDATKDDEAFPQVNEYLSESVRNLGGPQLIDKGSQVQILSARPIETPSDLHDRRSDGVLAFHVPGPLSVTRQAPSRAHPSAAACDQGRRTTPRSSCARASRGRRVRGDRPRSGHRRCRRRTHRSRRGRRS